MSPFHNAPADRTPVAALPAPTAAPAVEVDPLGLSARLPQPGWMVIDAVRAQEFTGEVVCATDPGVHVYADRGDVYFAERATDRLLGDRLVAAGALDADQLHAGAVRLGEVEHLGRLFDRDPSIDRDAVLVVTEMLTDDCLGWLAGETVPAASVIPYRHHPSGIHRWERPDADAEPLTPASLVAAPVPVMAAPTASATLMPPPAPMTPMAPPAAGLMPPPPPLSIAPGGPVPPPLPSFLPSPSSQAPSAFGEPIVLLTAAALPDTDPTLSWDEPGWLDRALPGDADPFLVKPLSLAPMPSVSRPTTPLTTPPPPAAGSLLADMGDWIDRLGIEGLPDRDHEPTTQSITQSIAPPSLGIEVIDRFEVIWPSGEIDEQFGSQVDETFPNPDIDRAGPTARMVRDGGLRVADATLADALGTGVADIEQWLASETGDAADDVVLAVRRTVADIDAGSLAARPTTMLAPTPTTQPVMAATARMTHPNPSSGSVFDTVPQQAPVVPPTLPSVAGSEDATGAPAGTDRSSALKRLIGSLRRR